MISSDPLDLSATLWRIAKQGQGQLSVADEQLAYTLSHFARYTDKVGLFEIAKCAARMEQFALSWIALQLVLQDCPTHEGARRWNLPIWSLMRSDPEGLELPFTVRSTPELPPVALATEASSFRSQVKNPIQESALRKFVQVAHAIAASVEPCLDKLELRL